MKHSVAVNVRVRPDGSAAIPFDRFQYPSSVIEGSDQTAMSSALTGDLVRKFIRGGTACTLMAYGQTGSGKTYTMCGTAEEPGARHAKVPKACTLPRPL